MRRIKGEYIIRNIETYNGNRLTALDRVEKILPEKLKRYKVKVSNDTNKS
tara:strand:- start:105 stop:254 length:150 start_codon:yes stop_codon:yes gene_type:complete